VNEGFQEEDGWVNICYMFLMMSLLHQWSHFKKSIPSPLLGYGQSTSTNHVSVEQGWFDLQIHGYNNWNELFLG
jgi:hypothetical protein